jgi:hypothetical protein
MKLLSNAFHIVAVAGQPRLKPNFRTGRENKKLNQYLAGHGRI